MGVAWCPEAEHTSRGTCQVIAILDSPPEEGSARLARFTLPRILGAGYYGPLLSSGDSPSGEHIMIAGENVVPEEDGVSGQHFMVWVPSVDYW